MVRTRRPAGRSLAAPVSRITTAVRGWDESMGQAGRPPTREQSSREYIDWAPARSESAPRPQRTMAAPSEDTWISQVLDALCRTRHPADLFE